MNRDLLSLTKLLTIKFQQLIREKRKELNKDEQKCGSSNKNNIIKHIQQNYGTQDEDIPTRKIFIDHVLCNETKFNDDEVRDHVYTIVAAGSETTALQTAHTSKKLMQIEVVKLVILYFRYSLSYAARDAPRDPGKSLRWAEGSFLLGWYRNHLRQHHEAGLLRENHQRVVAALSGCAR